MVVLEAVEWEAVEAFFEIEEAGVEGVEVEQLI